MITALSASPFLSSIRRHMLVRHYSKRTINTYLYWIKYFIIFNQKQHPSSLGPEQVEVFLTFLAAERNVSAATQSIALNALVYLYTNILNKPIGELGHFRRASRQRKLPIVLTMEEVSSLLNELQGVHRLMTALLYGSGLRRIELVRLRVKDIDFDFGQIQIWNGKGSKHRLATLAPELEQSLKAQIERVNAILQEDILHPKYRGAWMPTALARKNPNASKSLAWQYLFPSAKLSYQPGTRLLRRHHADETNINRFLKNAAKSAGIQKQVGSHTLRHSFATHLLQARTDIRTVQDQLGHADVKTTEIYTHVLKRGASGVSNPLSRLPK